RFEAFIDRMELANGYFEMTDASELRHRFEADRAARRQAGKPDMAIDFRLLEAMQKGLPECAGVALGFDRLVMSALGVENIADAVLFP
ncbi:MAG: amino acid--tRNA ligase-related protein, partial [bacterium]